MWKHSPCKAHLVTSYAERLHGPVLDSARDHLLCVTLPTLLSTLSGKGKYAQEP